jgi:preprotein translocase subunit SecG
MWTQLLPWLPLVQIILSVLLMASILMQSRGTGIGDAFGGSSSVYRTRRGIEKSLFRATIALAILFSLVSLLRILVS